MPFKRASFSPLYVEYVDEIFNPHPHPHIPHMRIIRIFRIFRIRMASPNLNTFGIDAFSTGKTFFQREDILHELIPKLFE